MNRPDGTVILRVPPLGASSYHVSKAWSQGLTFPRIAFEPKPMTLDAACAHAALIGGVVVLAKKRGPRGGWTQVRFMYPEDNPRRWQWATAHVGRVVR